MHNCQIAPQAPAFKLLLLRHPHSHDNAHQAEDHRRDSGRVDHAEGSASQVLCQQQPVAAVDQPVLEVKEAAQDGPCKTSHAMKRETIQRVVHKVQLLKPTSCKDAAEGSDGAYAQSTQRLHEAGAGSNVHLKDKGLRAPAILGQGLLESI